jgi:23S rRNA (cytosine1962-C5)-methyltransferase
VSSLRQDLQTAWGKRKLSASVTALRMFHGPGESTHSSGKELAIDRFQNHFWITAWKPIEKSALDEVIQFLKDQSASSNDSSAVFIERGETQLSVPLFGSPPSERFEVREGNLIARIQLVETRQPGLFLDHAPLRTWLQQNAKGWKVLNTFAYTGSLSVACGLGGADSVLSLDLSKPSLEWAKENWLANSLPGERADFIYGDYFDWLPKFAKQGRKFDAVILDPPSFSRGSKKSGSKEFSTAKDLEKLHVLALSVLNSGGYLITSINSANVSWKKFEAEIQNAAKELKVRLQVLRKIELPETFPAQTFEDAYLKGFIFRMS